MDVKFEQDSSFQATGPTPRILTGAFVQLIRHTFSSADSIENELLKTYLWHEDESITRILIEPAYKWKPEDVQRRPAVMVARKPMEFKSIGIGNTLQGNVQETGFQEDAYAVAAEGTHVFNCIGTSGTEAEAVAEEVWKTLLAFSAMIREQFCLGKFNLVSVGEVSPVDEQHRNFAVPVAVGYAAMFQWEVTRRTPEWSRISFQVNT